MKTLTAAARVHVEEVACLLFVCAWCTQVANQSDFAFPQHSWLKQDALGVWSTVHAAHTRPSLPASVSNQAPPHSNLLVLFQSQKD